MRISELPVKVSLEEKRFLMEAGYILMEEGRYDEAIATFQGALPLVEEKFHPLLGIGSARFWQARYDDAITAYEEVLHRNPNWALGYAHLGEALAFGGHKQEADLALRRAVELDPAGKQGGDVARNIQRLMAHGLI